MRQCFLAVVVFVITACAPQNDGGGGKADADEALVAGFGEIGPVRLGMSQAQIEAVIGVAVDASAAPPGGERSCYYLRAGGAFAGIGFMMNDDRLVRYDVWESSVRTRAGFGIGSHQDELTAGYEQGVLVSPHKYSDGRYLSVDDGSGIKLLFETNAAGVVERYRSGRAPEVNFVEGCA